MTTEGKVKSWNLARGFGFVVNNDGEDEAFVHTSNIDGGVLIEGKVVTYDTKPSERKVKGESKLVAYNLGGEGFKPKSGVRGQLSGVVKSWKHGKQMGFIKGDDGEEVYVHATSFGGGCLREGAQVYYDSEDVKHKSHRKAAVNVSGEGVIKGSMSGYVKRWIADRGFGFIEASDGCQVYVHCSSISDGHLVEGKEVYFNITEEQSKNGDKLATRKVGMDLSGPGVKDGPPMPGYQPMQYDSGKGSSHTPYQGKGNKGGNNHGGGKGGKNQGGGGGGGGGGGYNSYNTYNQQYSQGYGYGYGGAPDPYSYGYGYGGPSYQKGGGKGGHYHHHHHHNHHHNHHHHHQHQGGGGGGGGGYHHGGQGGKGGYKGGKGHKSGRY